MLLLQLGQLSAQRLDFPLALHAQLFPLADSRNRANAEVTGPDFSFVSFDPEFVAAELIDFVLTTWDFEVISNDIFDFRSSGIYLSDHLPVTARIKFK